jgi:hypothetical protein
MQAKAKCLEESRQQMETAYKSIIDGPKKNVLLSRVNFLKNREDMNKGLIRSELRELRTLEKKLPEKKARIETYSSNYKNLVDTKTEKKSSLYGFRIRT